MSDIYLGDCREIRSAIPDNSVDTIITDPPYGLEFMGKGWDKGVPGVEFWKEFLAVTKPGGMLLAFGGTRTFHRMTAAIEDAGWEIRDCLMWLYGSGFPKSLDISKAIDKAKGAEREVVGHSDSGRRKESSWNPNGKPTGVFRPNEDGFSVTAPATDLAREWSGWGTALKPAWEPIIVAMKPLDGTFAENAEKWGVAGINVDGGRIGTEGATQRSHQAPYGDSGWRTGHEIVDVNKGRWPANLLLDEEAAAMLDGQSGITETHAMSRGHNKFGGAFGSGGEVTKPNLVSSSGGASRFFYCAKASKSERNKGCEGLPEREKKTLNDYVSPSEGRTAPKSGAAASNNHPTVKPLSLMEYLCTLTKTPTGGIVLDPFAGSGSTLLAAKNTGREYIGIDQNPEYFEIIKARLGL